MGRHLYGVFGLMILFSMYFPPALTAQEEEEVDYNRYYRFPLSLDLSFQSVTPFAEYGVDFNVYELAAMVHRPRSEDPRLQPFLQIGFGQYDATDYRGDGDGWDHLQFFAAPGIAYVERFAREFEVGGDISVGGGYSLFPRLDPEYTVGLPYLFAELGGRMALNPSYGTSVELRPKLRYQLALPPSGVDIDDFDGLALGVGITVHYRFGEDPDSAAALIRSLRFSEARMDSVFAAMQSYYRSNPVGEAMLENRESRRVEQVEVSFFQAGLMDAPTPCARIDVLEAGQQAKVPLYAYFNERIFETEGVTPYTGEVIVHYEYRGRPAEQRFSVSYDLHDKTAITWNDAKKVAAFITPADSALRNYSSFVRQAAKEESVRTYNTPLQEAMQVYRALSVLGCMYQSDPVSPFTEVQENTMLVDSISLPRNTLTRITGDCDDLTVLYCSLLETLGIETAFITVPGHIFPAFNTKISSGEFHNLHPNREMTISLDGELWVPVEITLVGSAGFPAAWRKGAGQWYALDEQSGSREFFRTRTAQEVFRPVGLKESDLGLQYGSAARIAAGFRQDFREVQAEVLDVYEAYARERGEKRDYNRLGVKYSLFGRYDEADRAFDRALSLDESYLPTTINRGNLAAMRGEPQQAIRSYREALEYLENRGRKNTVLAGKIMLNLARSYSMIDARNEASEAFEQARELAPLESRRMAHLFSAEEGMGRASAADAGAALLFIEDYDEEE